MAARRASGPTPWHREPWVWLLIALPLSAVIGGLVTIYIAWATSDGLVVDDYYRQGKAINRILARDQAAAAHKLQATLAVDLQDKRLLLTLQAEDYDLPERLVLSLLHPTRKGHDQQLVLMQTGAGRYTGVIRALSQGDWHVQLEADDWRLSGRIQVPQAAPLILLPAPAG